MARASIAITFKYSGGTDTRQGVIFGKDGFSFNGSKIDRTFSFSKLDAALNANVQRGHRETMAQEVRNVSAHETRNVQGDSPTSTRTLGPMLVPSPQSDHGHRSEPQHSQSHSGDSLLSGVFDFELGPGEDHPITTLGKSPAGKRNEADP